VTVDTEKAIRLLSNNRFTVLFSGGKDSLAALLWILDNVHHDDWNILYVEVTGNTHRLCNEYVYRICEKLGVEEKLIHARRKDADFFDYVRRYGLPIIGKYRWCMWQFKTKLFQRHSCAVQVTGMRRTDSHRRRNLALIDYFRHSGFITVQPLLDWSTRRALEYIRDHGLEPNPCYRLYGHSGNCMLCPYHTVDRIVRTLQDPEWGPKIVDALLSVRATTSPTMRELRDKWLREWRRLRENEKITQWW